MVSINKILNYIFIVFILYIVLFFFRGRLISMNGGEANTANIVTEVKKIGYPTNDFDLRRFNIIRKINGGRSVYVYYVFSNIEKKDLEKFYYKTLKRQGWKQDRKIFTKENLAIEMNIKNDEISFIVSTT